MRKGESALRPRSIRRSGIAACGGSEWQRPMRTPGSACRIIPYEAGIARVTPGQRPARSALARSVMQDLGQELLRPLGPRLAEELVLARVLDDAPVVHEDDPVR